MKSYNLDLIDVYRLTSLSCFGIFFSVVFSIFFLNGLAWSLANNGLSVLAPLLSAIYILLIYLALPILVVIVLVKVLLKYGGGAMLFSLIIMAIQFAALFALAAVIASFFIQWEVIWQLLKGPMYVTINLG